MLYLLIFIDVKPSALSIGKSFVKHYQSLGVDKFFFILNGSPTDCISFTKFLDQQGVNYQHIEYHKEYNSIARNKQVDKMISMVHDQIKPTDWIFTLDADEFFVYPFGMSKDEFLAELDSTSSEYVVSYKLDMVSPKGMISYDMKRDGDIMNCFPIPTVLTQDVMRAKISKIPLSRYSVQRNNGANHNIKGKNYKYYKKILPLRHFKFYGNVVDEVYHRFVLYKRMYEEKAPGISTKYKNYERIWEFLKEKPDLTTYGIPLDKTIYITYNEKFQLKVHQERPLFNIRPNALLYSCVLGELL